MEEQPTNNTFDEARKEADPVAEYAAYGCCLALIMSAAIMAGAIYGIYKLIVYLL